ncbi:hypothetical protein [Prochlorococcus sp. MIT 1313]
MGRAVSLKGSAGDHCFACCACEWLCPSPCVAGAEAAEKYLPDGLSRNLLLAKTTLANG